MNYSFIGSEHREKWIRGTTEQLLNRIVLLQTNRQADGGLQQLRFLDFGSGRFVQKGQRGVGVPTGNTFFGQTQTRFRQEHSALGRWVFEFVLPGDLNCLREIAPIPLNANPSTQFDCNRNRRLVRSLLAGFRLLAHFIILDIGIALFLMSSDVKWPQPISLALLLLSPNGAKSPIQGDASWVDSPTAGAHLHVMIAKDEFNRGRSILVVPFTSVDFSYRQSLPNCVAFVKDSYPFITSDCVAQAEMLDRMRRGRLDHPIGRLSEDDLGLVLVAVANVLGVLDP